MAAPPALPPLSLDFVTGPMVVGTGVSTFLGGIMVTQCYTYWSRYPKDPTWMKIMVLYFLVTDFVHTAFELAITYDYTVTKSGNLKALLVASALFATIPILSVSISSVAQGFFAWRVGRLTRVRFLGWVIALLAIVQFLCGIGVTIAVTIVKNFLEFQKFNALVVPWLVSSAVCDLLITGSLVWYLRTNRSGIAATDDLVTRLIRSTVQTGMITLLWAVLDLIVYLLEDNSMHLVFNFPLAKLYTNSLMSTLNARRSHFESQSNPLAQGVGTSAERTFGGSGGKGTVSVPQWGSGSRQDRSVNILTTTTTEVYTHSQIHHDKGISRGGDPMYDDYEMQSKRDPSENGI